VRCELNQEAARTLDDSEILALSKDLQHHIKTMVGVSTKIDVMDPGTIPRTLVGKAKRVIDNRPQQI
jgi:phenylacetate-CoA ligase